MFFKVQTVYSWSNPQLVFNNSIKYSRLQFFAIKIYFPSHLDLEPATNRNIKRGQVLGSPVQFLPPLYPDSEPGLIPGGIRAGNHGHHGIGAGKGQPSPFPHGPRPGLAHGSPWYEQMTLPRAGPVDSHTGPVRAW